MRGRERLMERVRKYQAGASLLLGFHFGFLLGLHVALSVRDLLLVFFFFQFAVTFGFLWFTYGLTFVFTFGCSS